MCGASLARSPVGSCCSLFDLDWVFFSFSPFLFSLAVLFCVYGVGFGFLVLLLLDQRIKVGCSWLLSKCEASVFMSRWNVGWFGVDFDGTLDDEMRLD